MKKSILSVLSLSLLFSSCSTKEERQDKVIEKDIKEDIEVEFSKNDIEKEYNENEDTEIKRTMPEEEEIKKVVIEVKKENAEKALVEEISNSKKDSYGESNVEDYPIDVTYISGDTSPKEGDVRNSF